jgi:hypothetical protein
VESSLQLPPPVPLAMYCVDENSEAIDHTPSRIVHKQVYLDLHEKNYQQSGDQSGGGNEVEALSPFPKSLLFPVVYSIYAPTTENAEFHSSHGNKGDIRNGHTKLLTIS